MVIVIRMTGLRNDGWLDVPTTDDVVLHLPDGSQDRLVTTGTVEWDGDCCAEVWVPASRLAEWHAEWHAEHE